jgi:hypothetical protein
MEVSATQAGRLVNLSSESIRQWCAAGLLVHRRVGRKGLFRVEVESLRQTALGLGYSFDEGFLAELTSGEPVSDQ